MTAPYGGGSSNRHRQNADRRLGKPQTPQMTADDSLAVEAYGARGAAMRKTAGKMGEGLAKADSTKSSFISKVKRAITGG